MEEKKQKQEKKKLQNQMLLGVSLKPIVFSHNVYVCSHDAILLLNMSQEATAAAEGDGGPAKETKQQPAATVQGGAIPNPVLMFLNQRPLPSAVNQASKTIFEPKSQEDNVKVHLAGGYDYNLIFEARNQAQIKSELI